MTKKKISEALDAARRGDVDTARVSLQGVTSTFIQRRLEPLLPRDDWKGVSAAILWNLVGLSPTQDVPDVEEVTRMLAAPVQATARPPRLIRLPDVIDLAVPAPFLGALPADDDGPCIVDIDQARVAQAWGLVGVAALCREDNPAGARLVGSRFSPAALFARAIGLGDVVRGHPTEQAAEPERTFPLQRIARMEEIEKASNRISKLMIRDDEDSRRTLFYVLVELLRNVVQHSGDPLGGVVAAQRMDEAQHYPRRVIQVAVADAGVGVPRALRESRPNLDHPTAALTAALEPHVSGAFAEGRSGSRYNAGMGLFFIAEMAKLTAGRLMIATRGASLYLQGDLEGNEDHELRFLKPEGTGFPGTLVAFELPLDEVQDHDRLLEVIREKAYVRTPKATSRSLLRWTRPPENVPSFAVDHLAENTLDAEKLATDELQRRILERSPVALDFRGIEVCTQSFLHSLLYETLRLAWAKQVEVYVINTKPAVESGLKLVENYALAG